MSFQSINEQVYRRGMLTRKAIDRVMEKTISAMKRTEFGFAECREMVKNYKTLTRKDARGTVIVALGTYGWTGKFDAGEVANILLSYEIPEDAVRCALQFLDKKEGAHMDNERKAAIIRKGISQVVPKGITYEMSVSSLNVTVRFYPPVKRRFVNVLVEGAENIYAFLSTVLLVRPMLYQYNKRGMDFDTFSLVHDVWSMGESSYAYSYTTDTTGEEVLAKEKKSYKDYFAGYALPDEIKAVILDGVRNSIAGVKSGVYTDGEGCSYNSIDRKPIPEKGLWTGAAKVA